MINYHGLCDGVQVISRRNFYYDQQSCDSKSLLMYENEKEILQNKIIQGESIKKQPFTNALGSNKIKL